MSQHEQRTASVSVPGATGPSQEQASALGSLVSCHRAAPRSLLGALASTCFTGVIGVAAVGIGVAELVRPYADVTKLLELFTLGLLFCGVAGWFLWRLWTDFRTLVEVRDHGIVVARHGGSEVVRWSSVGSVTALQTVQPRMLDLFSGREARDMPVRVLELYLHLHDETRVTVPLDRLRDRRVLAQAIAQRLHVDVPGQ